MQHHTRHAFCGLLSVVVVFFFLSAENQEMGCGSGRLRSFVWIFECRKRAASACKTLKRSDKHFSLQKRQSRDIHECGDSHFNIMLQQ